MKTITVTFEKHTVTVPNVKYECECGHKFKRNNSSYFTINPFNNSTPSESRKKVHEEQSERKRNCPKCKKQCSPKI